MSYYLDGMADGRHRMMNGLNRRGDDQSYKEVWWNHRMEDRVDPQEHPQSGDRDGGKVVHGTVSMKHRHGEVVDR